MDRALAATFCIVYSVVAAVELLALAAIHRLPIHPVEPKWLHRVVQVVAQHQAVQQHQAADLVADQAVALRSLLAIHAALQAAEWKARAADLADRSFRLSKLSFAV